MSAKASIKILLVPALAACTHVQGSAPPEPLYSDKLSEMYHWAEQCGEWDEWDKPGPPYRIHGETYYVGTCGISAILVAGHEQHVLIDSGTQAGAAIVQDNIKALNFLISDVAVLMHSHEHFDHVDGMAKLQEASGARVYASKQAANVLRSGKDGAGDPQRGMHPPFPGLRVDKILANGEITGWDDTDFTVIETPGHTPGALSWQWESCEGSDCVTIVYADSMSPVSADTYRFSDHPGYVAEYRRGIARIAAAKCDILLTPHPTASEMNRRLADGSALVESTACERYAASITKRLDNRLAEEAARAE